MWVVRSLSAARRNVDGPLVLAAGFFDGVHRGHLRVLRAALKRARGQSGPAAVMTFDPHPLQVIRPEQAPPLLMTTDWKLERLAETGLDGCLLLRFDERMRALRAAEFLALLRRGLPTLNELVVGRNWRAGSDQVAALDGLGGLMEERGLRLTLVPPVRLEGRVVSSTRIRTAVLRGRLEDAARMLGQPFAVEGRVVSGCKVGRTLGFPTANLDPGGLLLPPPGVYAGSALVSGSWQPAAISLGDRPTFPRRLAPRVLEIHVLDSIKLNLYRRRLRVRFLKRLRSNRAFATPQALARQMERDIGVVRGLVQATGGKLR